MPWRHRIAERAAPRNYFQVADGSGYNEETELELELATVT